MLNELQPGLLQLIDLGRAAENPDATVAAGLKAGKTIDVGEEAQDERCRKVQNNTASMLS